MTTVKYILKPDYERHEGLRPINIYRFPAVRKATGSRSVTGTSRTMAWHARFTGLVTVSLLLAGCIHSKRTYIQVVDASSKTPVVSAKVTASLYNPVQPDLHRTHIKEVHTRTDGLAVVRIPLCSTRDAPVAYLYEGGRCVGRADPNSQVGPELLVEKEGYIGSALYRSNDDWKHEDTSPESPFVISLTKNGIEPNAATNAAPPYR